VASCFLYRDLQGLGECSWRLSLIAYLEISETPSHDWRAALALMTSLKTLKVRASARRSHRDPGPDGATDTWAGDAYASGASSRLTTLVLEDVPVDSLPGLGALEHIGLSGKGLIRTRAVLDFICVDRESPGLRTATVSSKGRKKGDMLGRSTASLYAVDLLRRRFPAFVLHEPPADRLDRFHFTAGGRSSASPTARKAAKAPSRSRRVAEQAPSYSRHVEAQPPSRSQRVAEQAPSYSRHVEAQPPSRSQRAAPEEYDPADPLMTWKKIEIKNWGF
jgi:hypothetical protein